MHLPKFKELINTLSDAYQATEDLKVMKCLVSYIPPDIFDILNKSMSRIGVVYD